MWLYVTADSPSGAQSECARVFQVLSDESDCKGLLCQPAQELAGDWLENCGKQMAKEAEKVSDLEAAFADQAERKPTPCVKEFKHLITAGCDPDHCEEEAQGWATRCGGTEGGVLSTLMVEQVANRNLDGKKKLKLDPRSCPTFAKSLQKQAACGNEKACKASWPEVEGYRARCESDEQLPGVATGLAQLSIAYGAGQEVKLTLVSLESATVEPGAVPLSLADGRGAILGLCQKHPGETGAYLAVRKSCAGTELTVARLSKGTKGSEQGVLQIGKVLVPSRPLTGPYPWLEVADEQAAAAKLGAAMVKKDLAAVLAAPEDEALGKLVQLAHDHGQWMAQSDEVKGILKDKDAELAPLFGKLAAIKVSGAKGMGDEAKLRALYHRAKKRPFADIRADGRFEIGAATRGFWVELDGTLPSAMKAYAKALEPLAQQAGQADAPTATQLRSAREQAARSARSCRGQLARRGKVEGQLEQCAFEGCDQGQMDGLLASWSSAHDRVQSALREVDLALSAIGDSALTASLTKDQGCDASPW